MRRLTAIGSAAIFMVCSFFAKAEERWVTIEEKQVHPTRLLAKLNAKGKSDSAALNRLLAENRLELTKRYRLVPGLVLLSVSKQLASVSPPSPESPEDNHDEKIKVDLKNLMEMLRYSGFFEYVELDHVSKIALDPSDMRYEDDTLWGLRNRGFSSDGNRFGVADADIDADLAWDITTGSRDVIVGVLDTGIWYTHNDLASQMWQNPGEIPDNNLDDDGNGWVDDVFGVNAVVNSGDPLDDEGHGTHIAGIIGASANDEGEVVGVAWDVQIMALKVVDSFGFVVDSDMIEGIEYGVAHGCRIINVSLGGPSFSQSVFRTLAEAQNRDVLIVAAAGNDGLNSDLFPFYPANYNLGNIISVASMNRFDQLSGFSNFGLNNVDIAAPGEETYSTNIGADDAYTMGEGTSFAAPYVSGVGVLLLSEFPELNVSELRSRILESAVQTSAYSGKLSTGGRVNAFDAFDAAPDGALEITVSPPSGSTLLLEENITVVVRVSDLFGITNAVVEAVFDENIIPFANDGEAPDAEEGDAFYTAQIPLPSIPGELSFLIRASAEEKEGIETVIHYNLVEPPSNDDFDDSIKVPAEGISLVTNTSFSTLEDGEPHHAALVNVDKTLWWIWTPAEDNDAFIDTSGSHFDTVIAIYTGNSFSELEEVASINNLDAKFDAYLSFPARRGVAYRIVVGGTNSDEAGTLRLRLTPDGMPDLIQPIVTIDSPPSGTVTTENRIEVSGTAFDPSPNASGVSQVLIRVNNETIGRLADGTRRWSVTAVLSPGENTIEALVRDFSGNVSSSQSRIHFFISDPPNDHFVNAELLEGLEGRVEGSNREATKQAGEPLHAGNLGGASLWYSYIPIEDGVLDLRTRGSNFDTLLALYVGEKVAELELIAANDDMTSETKFSRITQAVRSGVKYTIAVDGFSNENGRVNLRYGFTPSAVFDVNVFSLGNGSIHPNSGLQASGTEVAFTATPDPGFTFVAWEGELLSTDNPFVLNIDQDFELTARFAPLTITDDFENASAGLDYRFDGEPWIITDALASLGSYSIRSGQIENGESSSLIFAFQSRGGRGRFDCRVSSEEGWDFLEFYINGARTSQWSGEVAWQSFEFSIPAGDVELEWRYVKDFANVFGLDLAAIDNLDLPIGEPEDASIQLSILPFEEGEIKFSLIGEPDTNYAIEVSENLIDWSEFAVGLSDSAGMLRLEGDRNEDSVQQFFRAIRQ